MDERFSAYLDGESSPSETEAVLSALARDPELRQSWSRQHWLRAALREGDVAAAYDPGFADRVDAALASEDAAGQSEKVVRLSRRRWRAAASLAAAASVAGAVLLIGEPLNQGTEVAPAGVETSTVATHEPATQEVASREAAPTQVASSPNPARSDHWSVSDPAVADQLNGYLLEHNGLARGYGMSGATPSFLRVATYGRDARR